jgi:CHASE1-domain containing sensor protein
MFVLSRLSVAVTVALLLIGAGLTYGVYRIETSRREVTFERLLVETAGYVETRIEQHIALLSATQSFLEVHDEPTSRAEFAGFVGGLHLDNRYPGLQELGSVRVLTPGDEAQMEAILSQAYEGERRVWPDEVPGLRTAVVLLEPDDGRNHVAIGFDMATSDEIRGAMLEAMETEMATATLPLTLAQGITEGRQDGIIIFLPLQQTIGPEVEGFAFAPVRVVDLFDAVLEEYDPALSLRVSDDASPDLPLFESASFAEDEAEGRVVKHTRLVVAGRQWILTAVPSQAFDTAIHLRLTLFSALMFPLLALSTGYAVHWQGTAIRRARALNKAVQHSVEQKDLLLREMAHRMKNALTRVSAIARQTARESADKAALIENLNARLQAMSAAQDLLVLSGTDSADLEELLRFEIDQISGSAANPGHLSGPAVRLNERQAHALALVFHELATNALKYGAGAKAGGELRIHWAVEPGASGDQLRLIWEETTLGQPAAASNAAPGPGSGFGSRLLDAMIAGELEGRLTRDLQPGQLTIEIRFPLAQRAAT